MLSPYTTRIWLKYATAPISEFQTHKRNVTSLSPSLSTEQLLGMVVTQHSGRWDWVSLIVRTFLAAAWKEKKWENATNEVEFKNTREQERECSPVAFIRTDQSFEFSTAKKNPEIAW